MGVRSTGAVVVISLSLRRFLRRFLPRSIGLAVFAVLAASASVAAAQTPAQWPPDKAPAIHPIVFYLAHGEANACGPGCSNWIAADGKIDPDAAGRLQHLLARLKGPLPPLFLHSPGGQVSGTIELGRIVRARKLTVSVGHTIPLNCDTDRLSSNSCDTQIRDGQPIEARFDPLTWMCNSGCVYVLAGGSTRLIPPWVSLGIHDVGYMPTAGHPEPTKLAMMVGKEITDEHLRAYIREVGIDTRLLTEAFAVPFSSVARLSREDAARFGLDRREFGETVWQFVDKSAPLMRKAFFTRTDDATSRYINGTLSVFCGRGKDGPRTFSFLRENLSTDTADAAGQPSANLTLNGQSIALTRMAFDKLYIGNGPLPRAALESIEDNATLVLPAAELGRQQSGDLTLSMIGFTQARAKLQEACSHSAAIIGASAITVQSLKVRQALLTTTAQSAWHAKEPFPPGADKAQVDFTLGAPKTTVDTVSLYMSPANPGKVMAGYFDITGHLQHFARYVLKDDKIIDEIIQAELSAGQAVPTIRALLANAKNTGTDNTAAFPAPTVAPR